jgi:hypothetical protein
MFSLEYLRQFRIGPFAIFDTVASYVGALILSPLLSWLASRVNVKIPKLSWLWFTVPLAVVFHFIFNQSTPLMQMLANPENFQFYIAITMLFTMIYMGFREIHKIA